MTEEQSGWAEYRRLFEQEMKDNREFREESRQSFETLRLQLAEIKVERKVAKWVLGVGLPAVVATAVSATAKALGW